MFGGDAVDIGGGAATGADGSDVESAIEVLSPGDGRESGDEAGGGQGGVKELSAFHAHES